MLTLRFDRLQHLLCLGCHSDDIEIGAGGSILRWLTEHPRLAVSWVVFSAAGPRAEEARRSAESFLTGAGEKRILLREFRDGFFPAEWGRIKESFEELKRLPPPDLVLTQYGGDRHQDHRVLSELTWNTFRDQLILEYEIPKWDGDLGAPNVFVPLSDAQRRRKVDLLMEHFATQCAKRWFTRETFDGLLRLRGVECNAPSGYAEGFYGRKLSL
jgi:LmbE family N-acetylglucosaminyl deacetylase